MSTIRCIYQQQPKFPATDQHPAAVRYQVGGLFVDAIGGQPTQAEIDAVLNPTAIPPAGGFADRQRGQALQDLEAAIAALPAQQQGTFRLIQQLLKD